MKRLGFTLIELLVVLAILSLLIGVMVPGMASARRAAHDLATRAYVREVAMNVESQRGLDMSLPPAGDCSTILGRPSKPPSIEECTYSPDTGGGYIISATSITGKIIVFDGDHLREP